MGGTGAGLDPGDGAAVRIATRGSALALWQAHHVGALVTAAGAGGYELVVVETTADQRLDVQIWELGGKGVFVKEVQAAVLDGRADLAVHSAKDLPAITPDGLTLACVPERADPRDVLVGATLEGLAPGATVATGSRRRQVQLAERRPDLAFIGLRGNIATRLDKVPPGGAIVMAAAAIERLGLSPTVVDVLGVDTMLPQVGQGALAIECRADDAGLAALLASCEHEPSRLAVDTERAFLAELGGDCDLPAGAHCVVVGEGDGAGGERELVCTGLLAPDDGPLRRSTQRGVDPDTLGRAVAGAVR
ncbi:MAG: hydroxymethylbilane synthase [Acidimicrobiales bacterium]|nr:hydroxymethylbilane synthase [Acidimicrobiales bacterium]MCB1259820.1 hydroxymethylbilane synthase [Acidimicrobiales bacterium]